MSDLVKELLLRDEGVRLYAYTDHLGFLTIGVGRLIDYRKGGGISQDEAMYLLENDLKRIRTMLDSEISWWRQLDEVRQAVIISMAFQLGVFGLLQFRQTLDAVKAGDYKTAAEQMRRSRWAHQTALRAHRLAEAMESGDKDDLEL